MSNPIAHDELYRRGPSVPEGIFLIRGPKNSAKQQYLEATEDSSVRGSSPNPNNPEQQWTIKYYPDDNTYKITNVYYNSNLMSKGDKILTTGQADDHWTIEGFGQKNGYIIGVPEDTRVIALRSSAKIAALLTRGDGDEIWELIVIKLSNMVTGEDLPNGKYWVKSKGSDRNRCWGYSFHIDNAPITPINSINTSLAVINQFTFTYQNNLCWVITSDYLSGQHGTRFVADSGQLTSQLTHCRIFRIGDHYFISTDMISFPPRVITDPNPNGSTPGVMGLADLDLNVPGQRWEFSGVSS